MSKSFYVFLALLMVIVVWVYVLSPQFQKSGLHEYVKTHNLPVGTQIINGRQQVYYEYKKKRVFVTHDKNNHVSPKSSQHYIAWQRELNGQSQIFLHNLKTKTSLQLSFLRNNTALSLDGSNIVWQGWTGKSWAIYYFDGSKVKKISQNFAAIRPFIQNDQVLFAQQIDPQNDVWQTILYKSASGQSIVVAQGDSSQAAWPRFEGNKVKAGLEGSGAYY